MVPGDTWRHRQTKEIVRIEIFEFGFLSFSILRGGRWFKSASLWDEAEFVAKFEKVPARSHVQ